MPRYHNPQWKVAEHRKGTQFVWDASKVFLYFPKERFKRIRRGAKKPVFANANLLYYLLENENLIPEKWKEAKFIYFFGTMYRDSDGDLFVCGLCWQPEWNNGRWVLGEDMLAHLSGDCAFAVFAS